MDVVAGAPDLDRRASEVAAGLLDRTLPKEDWTHEGHVLACIALVRSRGPTDALVAFRAAIPPYNESTGVANTSTGGYHDTITAYYVWAVERLVASGVSTHEILAHPSIERTGALAWWDRETLMGQRARRAWRSPTRTPAGWPTTDAIPFDHATR